MQNKPKYFSFISLVNLLFWIFYLASALSYFFNNFANTSYQSLISIILINSLSIVFLVYFYLNKIKFSKENIYKIVNVFLLVLVLNFGINFILQNFVFGELSSSFLDIIKKQSYSFSLSFIFISFAISIKALHLYSSKVKQTDLAKTTKISTELDELKNQINPHFLFNVLNNIYIQIRLEPKKASDMLLKFSDILRYQLYDCVEEKVFLKSEVEFLQNYTELQKMRISNIDVKFEQKGNFRGLMVYPFMFLPFLESAFNNISNLNNVDKFIHINVDVVEKYIIFAVKNSENGIIETYNSENGGNFEKIKNRLEFFYKDNYELKINKSEKHFIVELKLYIK